MKQIITSMAAGVFLAALAIAQPITQQTRYNVTDLGTLGGAGSYATVIKNSGSISGHANPPDGSNHAVIWQKGQMTDLGSPGFSGKNSVAWGVNEIGQVVGQAETSNKDPNGEDFCGSVAQGLPFLGSTCVPFLWQNGVMTPLLTLGGYNGFANVINNQGVAAGATENTTRDPACQSPQKFQFKPTYWQNGKVQELATFPGDPNGIVFGINDSGQMTGSSGKCREFDPISQTYLSMDHALLWQNGQYTNLGSLGGATGNTAFQINSQGQVVGTSNLRGDEIGHAFLWTQAKGMEDLGTLPGDLNSSALGINDKGQVVGISLDKDFNLHAVLWENKVPINLNTLVDNIPGLYLQMAEGINSRGEIIGFAMTASGDTHAYLATPVTRTTAVASPKNTTVTVRQITLDGTASISADGKPLTYQWSIPQGSPSASILQGTTATPIIQFGQSRAVYTFLLTVTDSTGKSTTDLATVNFQGN